MINRAYDWKLFPVRVAKIKFRISCKFYFQIIAWTIYYMFASFTSDLPWQYCDNEFNDRWRGLRAPNKRNLDAFLEEALQKWDIIWELQELLLRDGVQGVRGVAGQHDRQQHHLPEQVGQQDCHHHMVKNIKSQSRHNFVTGHASLRRVCWPHSGGTFRSGTEAPRRWFYNCFTTFPTSQNVNTKVSKENSTMVPCIYTNISYCDAEPGAAEKVASGRCGFSSFKPCFNIIEPRFIVIQTLFL